MLLKRNLKKWVSIAVWIWLYENLFLDKIPGLKNLIAFHKNLLFAFFTPNSSISISNCSFKSPSMVSYNERGQNHARRMIANFGGRDSVAIVLF